MEEKCGRILVADDNEELCRMIETILTAEGYRHVTYVLSCEEAEKLLAELKQMEKKVSAQIRKLEKMLGKQ